MDWGIITPKYKKGDRVRPSERFHEQFRQSRLRGVEGTVVGFGHMPNVYRIKWDTRNSVDSLHDCFLLAEQSEEPERSAGDTESAAKAEGTLTHKINQESDNGE